MNNRSLNIFTISLLFLVIASILSECKKYPEDDKLSDETAQKRLVHKWQLKECKVDGEEKIDLIDTFYYVNPANQMNDSVVYSLRDFNLEIKYYITRINGKRTKVYDVNYQVTSLKYHSTCICNSTSWSFIEHKNKLKLNKEFSVSLGYGSTLKHLQLLYNEANNAWDIKKLTDKEMRLETMNSNNQKVNLKFNRL